MSDGGEPAVLPRGFSQTLAMTFQSFRSDRHRLEIGEGPTFAAGTQPQPSFRTSGIAGGENGSLGAIGRATRPSPLRVTGKSLQAIPVSKLRRWSQPILSGAMREMRVRPIWEVPTARQVADTISDFDWPSFGTLRGQSSRINRSIPRRKKLNISRAYRY